VRRIARHEIDEVIAALRGPLGEEAVHEVRKATKRLRALVRLVRDQMGSRRYRRENHAFRDAARALSPARDAEVLLATAERLAARLGSKRRLLEPVARAARRGLRRARRGMRPDETRRLVAAMRRARARVESWPIADDGWAAVAPGVRRIYRRSRAAWRDAGRTPTVANLHEWRKRAKDLRYTLDLLEPLWPPVLHALADEADALGDRLGEDHDLALLRRLVCEVLDDAPPSRAVLAEIDVARRRLQAESWTRAARLYDARPGRFTRRLATYWRAWRAERTPDDEDAIAAAPSDDRELARA
jgi:CHAD domain-containing protein